MFAICIDKKKMIVSCLTNSEFVIFDEKGMEKKNFLVDKRLKYKYQAYYSKVYGMLKNGRHNFMIKESEDNVLGGYLKGIRLL